MLNTIDFLPRTPKRSHLNKKGKSGFYDYYAGYSSEFVEDVLNFWNLPHASVILDPWNGSGTTTNVAAAHGYKALGFDINPVMLIVAKSREISPSAASRLEFFKRLIIERYNSHRSNQFPYSDPLEGWLTLETSTAIRNIEALIQTIIIKHKTPFLLYHNLGELKNLSAEASFFYVGLFRLLREISLPLRSSNPTWIKRPKLGERKISISDNSILEIFQDQVEELIELLHQEQNINGPRQVRLDIAMSENLPLEDKSVNAIVTSPPYCTRIDYAVLTSLELGLLGCSQKEMKHLRQNFMGTPVISKTKPVVSQKWGQGCLKIIDAIGNHESKASQTYYLRTYLQYFDSLNHSLRELNRVLKNDGQCVLVVQNSYYKNVYINLAEIIKDMTEPFHWEIVQIFDYLSPQNMLQINSKSKKYRVDGKEKEFVLFFKKEGSDD
ncbi:DNA methyltransferase [Sporolactobacillus sp. Y61]|uniref:site-specific DNA-methyltransferase (cytosine-N(4)-specific) n=1 Tax=Sporolactobacillus sp. Y61 TaxID=3160863 RepID=A0AAU8IG51_9BACL